MSSRNYTYYSESELRSLASRADRGDSGAMKQLHDINAQLAKRANMRLTRLERSGFDYYAYDRATGFLASEFKSNRFSTRKSLFEDAGDLKRQIMEEQTFLQSKSSTVAGQKDIMKKQVEAFREKGYDIPEDQEQDFMRFLGNETISQVLKPVKGSSQSETIVNLIKNALTMGHTYADIDLQFRNYNAGTMTYDDVFERLKKTKRGRHALDRGGLFYERKKNR